jgi:hypothetical protein
MIDSLIDSWLDLPVAGLFACLLAYQGGVALLLWVAVYASPLRNGIATLGGVVAPFFTSVAVLFALLTGFLANDVGARNRAAAQAVGTEAGALHAAYTLGLASRSDTSAITDAVRVYLRTVTGDEWRKMDEEKKSAAAEAAFQTLLQAVSDPKISQEASSPVHAALLQNIASAHRARLDRLDLSNDRSPALKWLVVLLLSAMTQIAIAVVHLDKRRAFVASLAIFSVASVMTLGLIALQEYPFSGPLRISPAPFEDLLKAMPSD